MASARIVYKPLRITNLQDPRLSQLERGEECILDETGERYYKRNRDGILIKNSIRINQHNGVIIDANSNNVASLEVGAAGTSGLATSLTLYGNTNFNDYGLRLERKRDPSGEYVTNLIHKEDNDFSFLAPDGGSYRFNIFGQDVLTINPDQTVTINNSLHIPHITVDTITVNNINDSNVAPSDSVQSNLLYIENASTIFNHFVGDELLTTTDYVHYSLAHVPLAETLTVYVDGLKQTMGSTRDFTIVDNNITFTTPNNPILHVTARYQWQEINVDYPITNTISDTIGFVVVDGLTLKSRLITGSAGRVQVINNDGKDGNARIDLTTTGVIPGSYNTLTVDSYGRVLSGSNADILLNYSNLSALNNVNTSGYIYRNNGIYGTRLLEGTTGRITVTNPSGTIGNPRIDLHAIHLTQNTYNSVKVDEYGRVIEGFNTGDSNFGRVSTNSTFNYDLEGNLTSMTETINGLIQNTSYIYNSFGEISQTITTYNGKTRIEVFTYNSTNGKLISMTATES
jgi:hypothetical protein